jgi:thiamine biosynthesis protein ThiC
MELFMIRRRTAWKSPDELGATAERSKQVAEDEFPDDIRWIRSYVISEPDGSLGTVCIYQATDEDAVKRHASKVEMPADEVLPVADTVIVRPDPEPAATG